MREPGGTALATTEFEKDFGYLMPFIDKVAAAAGNLSDSGSRAELNQLIVDEKRRWARIRELLSGSGSVVNSNRASAAASSESETSASSPVGPKPSFTVGSLRPKSD